MRELAAVEVGVAQNCLLQVPPLWKRWLCRTSSIRPLNRSTMPFVWGRFGGCENERLRQESRRLQEEREVQKRQLRSSRIKSHEFQFIADYRGICPVVVCVS